MIHSFPFYIADWRDSKARMRMNRMERCLYLELLIYCWGNGTLPADEPTLMAIAGFLPREFAAAWPKVRAEFVLVGDEFRHHKVDEKRPEVIQSKEDRKRGAEIANEVRRAKRLAGAERNAERNAGVDAQCTPPSSPSPSTTTTTPPSTVLDAECAAFEIWEAFPADRQGALQTVEHALTDLIGPLNEPERSNRLRRILGNFSDYKRSDQVQRGVWYGAARWVREFGLTDWASANLATARPKKLTEVDKFKAEMGIQNAM